jgi:hypothetical protein
MYIRHLKREREYSYILRESFSEDGCWRHRDLMDLGADPGALIQYPGGNGFYFDARLEDALRAQGARYSSQDLEDVFLPFMDPHIRRIVENFRSGDRSRHPRSCTSADELLRQQKELHDFDKRRLHYLRCGRVDIGKLDHRVWKFLNVLLERSRDEIEHIIDGMERRLRAHEVRPYLFTALHLQRYFPQHLMRNHPIALDPEKVDSYFLEEICHLNEDVRYFRGVTDHSPGILHPQLVKYVTLYFDHEFGQDNLWHQLIEEVMRQRSFRRPPRKETDMAVEEACRWLAITVVQFEGMKRLDLIRCYRNRAKEMHPDRGGDHNAFVSMTEAYEVLLLKKR